jgi:hypothetical protein
LRGFLWVGDVSRKKDKATGLDFLEV